MKRAVNCSNYYIPTNGQPDNETMENMFNLLKLKLNYGSVEIIFWVFSF